MRARFLPLAVTLLLVAPLHAGADSPTERPRIGLVLGGGGARGGAHIGVLRVLEELRVPVDYVAGTSIGSIIGGLYAAGLSPDQMQAEVTQIDWAEVFDDSPTRWRLPLRRKEDDRFNYAGLELGITKKGVRAPAGIVTARNLNFLLGALTLHTAGVTDFDHLPLPFRAVATDLSTGDIVVLDHGSLAIAMRASMAIPGALTPVEWDGRVLVDGGLVANLPIATARQMGADIVIAVDITQRGIEGKPDEWSLIEIGVQTIGILMADNTNRSRATLTDADVVIEPDLRDISLPSFDRMTEAIAYGEAAARSVSDALSRLSVGEEEYAEFLAQQRRAPRVEQAFDVDEIEIAPMTRVPEKLVRRRLEIEPGDRVDTETLHQDLERVYQIGEFEQVGFELQQTDRASRLAIRAKEKDTGPNYLRFGIRIQSGPDENTDFGLLLYHRWTFINRLGAEWLNRLHIGDSNLLMSEFYQPLSPTGFLFVAARAELLDEDLLFFNPNGTRDVLGHTVLFGQLDGGLHFSNLAELRGGLRWGGRRTEFASLPGSDERSRMGEWYTRLTVDVLNNVGFPTLGASLIADAHESRADLGADDEYFLAWGRATLVGSLWRNTLALSGELGNDFATGAPAHDQLRLGGFMRLSGFDNGERAGGVMALATAALYRQVGTVPEALGKGFYAGLTGEVGNAWASQNEAELADLLVAGSVFLGVDTVLGPLYTAYGIGEGGRSTLYFILDRLFPGPHLP